jgi:hypothetical protein
LQVEREELLRKRGHEEKVVEVQYITIRSYKKSKQTDGVAKESNQNGSVPEDNDCPDH